MPGLPPENGTAVAFASSRSTASSPNAQQSTGSGAAPGTLSRRSFEAIGSIGALFQKLARPNQAGSPAGAGSGEATAAAGPRVAMP